MTDASTDPQHTFCFVVHRVQVPELALHRLALADTAYFLSIHCVLYHHHHQHLRVPQLANLQVGSSSLLRLVPAVVQEPRHVPKDPLQLPVVTAIVDNGQGWILVRVGRGR
uniref:(northern house mosquito) hypothetical protein n=1 Tax=Culex pipiens TaxID=7175 RepID=A0A8D8C064_CULPI